MCEASREADIVEKTRAELEVLGREHPDWWEMDDE